MRLPVPEKAACLKRDASKRSGNSRKRQKGDRRKRSQATLDALKREGRGRLHQVLGEPCLGHAKKQVGRELRRLVRRKGSGRSGPGWEVGINFGLRIFAFR